MSPDVRQKCPQHLSTIAKLPPGVVKIMRMIHTLYVSSDQMIRYGNPNINDKTKTLGSSRLRP